MESPLIVLLGNDDDDDDHAILFAEIDQRIAPAGTWISNAPGNTRRATPLVAALREIAERASRALDTLYAGVDVARDAATGELAVYEVNTCPTCSATFTELGIEPVVLSELAAFLVAAGRDFDAASRDWRPIAAAGAC